MRAKKQFIVALFFNWICFASLAWSGTYWEANQAYANKDFETAAIIYKKLVSQNEDEYSAYKLAGMYLDGKGIEQNTSEAIHLYKLAIKNGFNKRGLGHAAVTLGWIYQTGEYPGVSKNSNLARFWNNFGAYLDHPAASDNLAQIYANGFGVIEDTALVVKHLEEALKNYTDSYDFLLSEPDEWLEYVETDDKVIWDARAVYRKAIKTGDGSYKFELAQIYKDLVNSTPIVADLNFLDGKSAFDSGNYKEAVIRAKLLSINGDKTAQFYLGKMYENGLGLLQRHVNAHMWYNIASFNGSIPAISARDALFERMTQAAIEQAQDQAVACMQSKYRDCQLDIQPQLTDQSSVSNSIAELTDQDIEEIKDVFFKQTPIERKQTQYALKFFGLYEDQIDGLWGRNTIKALKAFQQMQSIAPKTPRRIIGSLVGEIVLPIKHFESPKTNVTSASPTASAVENQQILALQRQALEAQLEIQRQALEAQREAARMQAQQQAADRLYNFGMSLAFPKY
jgi:TPR repeat protein